MQLKANNKVDSVLFDDKTLFTAQEEYADDSTHAFDLPFEIPRDNQKFYEHFGYLEHDYNRGPDKLPTKVKKLAPYQLKFADMDFGIALKSNKVGMTTSEMILGDFHTRLLPEYAGFDCLIAHPKQEIANDLVMRLKKLVAASENYSQFLIKRPDFMEFKEEKSKVGVMYIRNPYNPRFNSRIIAVTSSIGSVFSRMRINRIHITDPALMRIKKEQDNYFAGLFARLANTGGQLKIEGVPLSRTGWFWKICKAVFQIEDSFEDSKSDAEKLVELDSDYEIPASIAKVFGKMKITIDDAIAAEVIPAHLKKFYQSIMSPAKFRQTFMAEFLEPEGAVFGKFEIGEHSVEEW